MLSESRDAPADRKRFLREGRLAAQLSHPHSVYVFGTEEIDGTPVIAMEIASGGTLASPEPGRSDSSALPRKEAFGCGAKYG